MGHIRGKGHTNLYVQVGGLVVPDFLKWCAETMKMVCPGLFILLWKRNIMSTVLIMYTICNLCFKFMPIS